MNTYNFCMTFSELSLKCGCGKWGYEGRSSDNYGFEWTCRHKSNIPKGHSWGICSERTCPLLPRKVTNLKIFNNSGKLIATANEAELKLG